MLKIIKRDGREVPYDNTKIRRAIEAANQETADEDRISDTLIGFVVGRIERRCDALGREVHVEEIQDMVIDELDRAEAYRLARHYSDYRIRHEQMRKTNTTDGRILSLIERNNEEARQETCLHIFNKYHGRMVHVTFDEDPGHYYVGRASVSEPQRVALAGQLTISVDAELFRYESDVYEVTFTGSATAVSGTVENLRMPVNPIVTVASDCQLFHDGTVYELEAGTQAVPGLVLHSFDNEVAATGTNSITFRFRRGCL